MENDVLDEIHCLIEANLSQGLHLDPLSKLVDNDKQVGHAPGHFLEGPQKVQAPHKKHPCNGDCLELLGCSVDLPHDVLSPPTGPHDLHCIASGHWSVKTLLESLPNHASRRSVMSIDPLMNIEE
jgi:hypothetical protein